MLYAQGARNKPCTEAENLSWVVRIGVIFPTLRGSFSDVGVILGDGSLLGRRMGGFLAYGGKHYDRYF